jgi:phosphatidylglycerol---prolipoprotein diacylglyceryl transferase
VHPSLYGYPAYDVLWGGAALVGLVAAVVLLRARGLDARRALPVLLLVAVAAVAGAKLEFCRENDLTPACLRAVGGLRMPGALLALALTLPPLLWVAGLPVRRVLDTLTIPIALSIALGRWGCFLNGCCFGVPTTLPWGVRFPRGSLPYLSHAEAGLVTLDQAWSLPVHPLALYYSLDALVIAAILLWALPRARFAGEITLWFLFLRCWSKTLLESLRGVELGSAPNRSGSVEFWVAWAVTMTLVALWWSRRERVPAVVVPARHAD